MNNTTLILNPRDELTVDNAVTILKGLPSLKPGVAGITVSPDYLKKLSAVLQTLTGTSAIKASDCPFSQTPIFEKVGQTERAIAWASMDELQKYLRT